MLFRVARPGLFLTLLWRAVKNKGLETRSQLGHSRQAGRFNYKFISAIEWNATVLILFLTGSPSLNAL